MAFHMTPQKFLFHWAPCFLHIQHYYCSCTPLHSHNKQLVGAQILHNNAHHWSTYLKILSSKTREYWLTIFLWVAEKGVLNRIHIYICDCSLSKVSAKLNHSFLQFLVEILSYFIIWLCTTIGIPFSWYKIGQNVRKASNGSCVVYPKWSCSQIIYVLHHHNSELRIMNWLYTIKYPRRVLNHLNIFWKGIDYIRYSSIDLLNSHISKKASTKIILTDIKCVQSFMKIILLGHQASKYATCWDIC